MSSPEVDFVLDTLGDVVGAQPADHPLRRVDRDDSDVYDGSASLDMSDPIHSRTDSLSRGNYVSASLINRPTEAVGTEYDHYLPGTIVNVRVEGMVKHGTAWGHVDPDGSDGVVFDTLVTDIRRRLLEEREWPAVGREHTTYHTLAVQDEDNQSSGWRDFYRTEFDCAFRGYEDLP